MIAIIDLGAGESDFLINTIENSGEKVKLTTDETEIIRSDRIILTASDDTAYALRQLHLFNLFTVLRICRKPLLAICSAMHLLADKAVYSTDSFLGIFPVNVFSFESGGESSFRGTHKISFRNGSPLYKDIPDGEKFYFNNSFYVPENEFTTSVSGNNIIFSASMEIENFLGIQFCPGRSGAAGIKIIRNFLELQVK